MRYYFSGCAMLPPIRKRVKSMERSKPLSSDDLISIEHNIARCATGRSKEKLAKLAEIAGHDELSQRLRAGGKARTREEQSAAAVPTLKVVASEPPLSLPPLAREPVREIPKLTLMSTPEPVFDDARREKRLSKAPYQAVNDEDVIQPARGRHRPDKKVKSTKGRENGRHWEGDLDHE